MIEQYTELRKIKLQDFITKSSAITFKIVGMIKTIFKHKKYIVEVYLSRKPVIRSHKRYNQFEALYELIRMKYQNYDLGEFPSKFQIFGKEETRKEFFQTMLNKIIQDHSWKNQSYAVLESNRRLLSILYLFLTSDMEQLDKKQSGNQNIQDVAKEKNQDDFNLGEEQKRRINSEIPQKQKAEVTFEQKFFHEAKTERKHRLSFEEPRASSFNFLDEPRPRRNSLQNECYSLIEQQKTNTLNQFQFKFEYEQVWKKRFVVILGSGLLLFRDRLDNYFRTRIQLFRINVQFEKRNKNAVDHFCEKMQFHNLTRTFKQNASILTLYHDNDYQKVYIRKPLISGEDPQQSHKMLLELKDSIIKGSQYSPIRSDFEGVYTPIGKLFIYFHQIVLNWKKIQEDQTIFLRIKTAPVLYDTRPIIYNPEINIHQGFLIPISNTYQIITIQCLSVKDEGWIKQNTGVPKIMGSFSFTMAELLTKPNGYLLEKIQINLETKESKIQKYSSKLIISLENFSTASSVYSDSFANENDGKVLKQIKGFENIDNLTITVDRVLRVIGVVALLVQSFWRNVYHFKYPRIGYLFFSCLAIIAIFFDANDFVKLGIFNLLCTILYQNKTIRIIIEELLVRYFYCYLHPSFTPPQILSTNQMKFLKWSKGLQYITEEYQMVDGRQQRRPEKKRRSVYEFTVHDKVFYFREEEQSFLQKMKEARKVIDLIYRMINTIISTIEKIGNLLSWVDYKRTLIICFLLLLLLGIASGWVMRIIITFVCIHRIVKGLEYYKEKHYQDNRKFAIHGLKYIIEKNFPSLMPNKEQLKKFSTAELDFYLCQIIFPIQDESSQQKLKKDMEEIMGVYLDPEQFYSKAFKKNSLKLYHLLHAIQTCESKLKLKQISGPEGLTNQFQELRQKTKEVPVIDVWLESLIFNFIFNIPSQLYTASSGNNLHKLEEVMKERIIKSPKRKNTTCKQIMETELELHNSPKST